MLKSRAHDRFYKYDVTTWDDEKPEMEAELAFEFLKFWGTVTLEGEDAAGRQARRLMRPYELVTRAFVTAHEAIKEARARRLAGYTAARTGRFVQTRTEATIQKESRTIPSTMRSTS